MLAKATYTENSYKTHNNNIVLKVLHTMALIMHIVSHCQHAWQNSLFDMGIVEGCLVASS